MYICIYIYACHVYIYIYIHSCVCTYKYTCILVYIYIYIHTYIYSCIYMCIYVYVYIYAYKFHIHTYVTYNMYDECPSLAHMIIKLNEWADESQILQETHCLFTMNIHEPLVISGKHVNSPVFCSQNQGRQLLFH